MRCAVLCVLFISLYLTSASAGDSDTGPDPNIWNPYLPIACIQLVEKDEPNLKGVILSSGMFDQSWLLVTKHCTSLMMAASNITQKRGGDPNGVLSIFQTAMKSYVDEGFLKITIPQRAITSKNRCGFSTLPYDRLRPFKETGVAPQAEAERLVFENCGDVLKNKADIKGQFQECLKALDIELDVNPCGTFTRELQDKYKFGEGLTDEVKLDEVNDLCGHILSKITDPEEKETQTERYMESLTDYCRGLSAFMASYFGK